MNSSIAIFLGIFTVCSVAATIVKCRKHRSYILLKPVPMLMLIAALAVYTYGLHLDGSASTVFRMLILCGLLLGLAGDMFLLNSKKFFLQGLVAFLLGHVAYIAAFIYASHSFRAYALASVLPCALYFSYFVTKLSKETRKKFLPAIAAYFFVITVMAVSAFSFDAGRGSALPVFGIAAAVFCVSDATLAWGIFVKENTFINAVVLLTYYVAQLIIAMQSASLML